MPSLVGLEDRVNAVGISDRLHDLFVHDTEVSAFVGRRALITVLYHRSRAVEVVRVWVGLQLAVRQIFHIDLYRDTLAIELDQDGVVYSQQVLVEVSAGFFASPTLAVPPGLHLLTR